MSPPLPSRIGPVEFVMIGGTVAVRRSAAASARGSAIERDNALPCAVSFGRIRVPPLALWEAVVRVRCADVEGTIRHLVGGAIGWVLDVQDTRQSKVPASVIIIANQPPGPEWPCRLPGRSQLRSI